MTNTIIETNIPTFEEFQKRWLKEMESLSMKLARNSEAFSIEMEHYPQTFLKTYNIRWKDRQNFLKAALDFVIEMKQLSEANVLQRNKKLWDKIGIAHETINRVAEHHNIPMNKNGMAGFVGYLFLMLNRFPDTFAKFYHIK